jgi:hypothetical protein
LETSGSIGTRLDNARPAAIVPNTESADPPKSGTTEPGDIVEGPSLSVERNLPELGLPSSQPQQGIFSFDINRVEESARRLVDLLTEPVIEIASEIDWSSQLWLASLVLGSAGVAGALRYDLIRRTDEKPLLSLESTAVRG